jgi:hypothetical protein
MANISLRYLQASRLRRDQSRTIQRSNPRFVKPICRQGIEQDLKLNGSVDSNDVGIRGFGLLNVSSVYQKKTYPMTK